MMRLTRADSRAMTDLIPRFVLSRVLNRHGVIRYSFIVSHLKSQPSPPLAEPSPPTNRQPSEPLTNRTVDHDHSKRFSKDDLLPTPQLLSNV